MYNARILIQKTASTLEAIDLVLWQKSTAGVESIRHLPPGIAERELEIIENELGISRKTHRQAEIAILQRITDTSPETAKKLLYIHTYADDAIIEDIQSERLSISRAYRRLQEGKKDIKGSSFKRGTAGFTRIFQRLLDYSPPVMNGRMEMPYTRRLNQTDYHVLQELNQLLKRYGWIRNIESRKIETLLRKKLKV